MVLVHRSVPGGFTEYAAVGPVPGGAVLRRLVMVGGLVTSGTCQIGASVCESSSETVGNFVAGSALIVSDSAIGGVTEYRSATFRVGGNTTLDVELPVDVAVGGGPAWVVYEIRGSSGSDWILGVGFELVKKAEELAVGYLGSAREDGNVGVMSRLRVAAESARA